MSKSNHGIILLGQRLRKLREERKISLTEASYTARVDIAILFKMETGERKLNKEVIQKLAKLYEVKAKPLIIQHLAEKILYLVSEEPFAPDGLKLAAKNLAIVKGHKRNPFKKKLSV